MKKLVLAIVLPGLLFSCDILLPPGQASVAHDPVPDPVGYSITINNETDENLQTVVILQNYCIPECLQNTFITSEIGANMSVEEMVTANRANTLEAYLFFTNGGLYAYSGISIVVPSNDKVEFTLLITYDGNSYIMTFI